MSNLPDMEFVPPLKFKPVYCERPWGGTLLSELLKRQTPDNIKTGESWELSDRPGFEVTVDGGALDGATLSELMHRYGRAFVGSKAPSTDRFPLLVKLIDAGERLSLQVHPDEQMCAKLADGSEPKTEMWYVIAARRGAKILAGLNERTTKLQFQELMSSPDVEKVLQVHRSEPGDAYYIHSGMVHAIGGGNLLLEIQQNSDTTYRLSDWGRVDAQGNSRRLDVEKGLAAIDFFNRNSPRIPCVVGSADFNRKYTLIGNSQFFRVTELRLVKEWSDNTENDGSFHLITAINGRVRVCSAENDGRTVELNPGETGLVPARFGSYRIQVLDDGETTVLKTTL